MVFRILNMSIHEIITRIHRAIHIKWEFAEWALRTRTTRMSEASSLPIDIAAMRNHCHR